MYAKLARRNIRRSAKDYIIYFVTVTITVALMFAFNSIIFSDDIQSLNKMISNMNMAIVFVSAIVVFVVGWLINYITRFTLQKRSREFGTYLVLGMEKRTISRMFLLENLAIGAVSFGVGVLLGALLFQIFSAVILNVFGAPYQISLSVSWEAALLTLGYFAAVYLFALLRNNRSLRRVRVHELLGAEHKNEKVRLKRGRGMLLLFLLSLVCAAGCIAFVHRFFKASTLDQSANMLDLGIGLLLLVAFLYLFYISFCSFLLFVFHRSKRWKYKNNNLFLLRQTTSKINSNGALMGTLALLLTLTFLSLSTAVIFNEMNATSIRKNATFDLGILVETPGVDFTPQIETSRQYGEVESAVQYGLYRTGNSEFRDQLEGTQFGVSWMESDLCIGLTAYNQLRQQLGYKPADMTEEGFLLHADREMVADYVSNYAEENGKLRFGGTELRYTGTYQEDFSQGSVNGFYFLIVVPDAVLGELEPYSSNLALKTKDGLPSAAYEPLKALSYIDADGNELDDWGLLVLQSKDEEESKSMFTILSFLLFYLGLVFICASATILAVQQLSDSAKYRYRFDLLRKLGLGHREINRIVLRQLLVYFGLPVICPVVMSSVLLSIANMLFWPMLSGRFVLYSYLLLTFLLFLIVYACYFLACYAGFKQNISPKR